MAVNGPPSLTKNEKRERRKREQERLKRQQESEDDEDSKEECFENGKLTLSQRGV